MGQIGTEFADDGLEVISDTNAHTGNFFALQALTDLVISAITASNVEGTITGITIPKGVIVYMKFTSITFTSGTGLAYKSAQQ